MNPRLIIAILISVVLCACGEVARTPDAAADNGPDAGKDAAPDQPKTGKDASPDRSPDKGGDTKSPDKGVDTKSPDKGGDLKADQNVKDLQLPDKTPAPDMPPCGNGAINGGEQCDGINLNSKTCKSQGYVSGTLKCTKSCTFDLSGCTKCGNNTIDKGETCDGTALGGATCGALKLTGGAYIGGTLKCSAGCTLDASGCTWVVGTSASSNVDVNGIAADSAGNSVITGLFSGSMAMGSTTMTAKGGQDAFVARLGPDGKYSYVVQAGGTKYTRGLGVDLDGKGNAHVVGTIHGTATFGSTTLTTKKLGWDNIFVAKLDPLGKFVWAVRAGGTDGDQGTGIGVDSAGNIFISGSLGSASADFGSQTLIKSSGNPAYFAARLNSSGSFTWAGQATSGGVNDSAAALDGSGNGLYTGKFSTSATFGSTTLTTPNSTSGIFVAKLSPSGAYAWVAKANGTQTGSYVFPDDIAVNSGGDSVVTGYIQGSVTFGSTSMSTTGSIRDLYVARLDKNGSFAWTAQAKSTDYTKGLAVALDGSNNVYVAGYLNGSATLGNTTVKTKGSGDILVAKIYSTGKFAWAANAGGTDADEGHGVAVDSSGNLYVTGSFNGTATFGSTSLTAPSGKKGLFVWKIANTGP